jgi:hypothetical protein
MGDKGGRARRHRQRSARAAQRRHPGATGGAGAHPPARAVGVHVHRGRHRKPV